jgi:hypothetical protein
MRGRKKGSTEHCRLQKFKMHLHAVLCLSSIMLSNHYQEHTMVEAHTPLSSAQPDKPAKSSRFLTEVDRLSSLHKQCKNVYKERLLSSREEVNSRCQSPVLSYVLSSQLHSQFSVSVISATISELGKKYPNLEIDPY